MKDETLLILGSLISIVYLSGFVLAQNLATIYLSDFLGGAAMVIINASSYSYASKLIPPDKRGKQFAWFNATFFLSWGLPGTLMTGPLVDKLIAAGYSQIFSYRMSFALAAAMVIIGTVVLFLNFRMKKNRILTT
jgi:MFS family permease